MWIDINQKQGEVRSVLLRQKNDAQLAEETSKKKKKWFMMKKKDGGTLVKRKK